MRMMLVVHLNLPLNPGPVAAAGAEGPQGVEGAVQETLLSECQVSIAGIAVLLSIYFAELADAHHAPGHML